VTIREAMEPREAFIVDCVRTASGRRMGRLSKWHPADLGASVCDALIERLGIKGSQIDDCIFGCVSQIGAQSCNVGRNVVLSSRKMPISVPGVSVDRQCGSGQQAIHFAVQAVMSGEQDVVIAGGVEVMSTIPIFSNFRAVKKNGRGHPHQSAGIEAKYGKGVEFSQFEGAELLAKKYNIDREEMDQFAFTSHIKASNATKLGKFKNEIVPVMGIDQKTKKLVIHDSDEGIRENISLTKLRTLKPLLTKKDLVTAGTSSQISDGAAALLICNKKGMERLGVSPRGRVVSLALAGSCPRIMLEGPIPATKKALEKAGMKISDIDFYEVNEAFASVPLAWKKALNADEKRLNINGGAIALGHPLGCTGVKLMTTLLNSLEQENKRFGLLAICEGGGTANATIIENLSYKQSKL